MKLSDLTTQATTQNDHSLFDYDIILVDDGGEEYDLSSEATIDQARKVIIVTLADSDE